MSKNRAVIIVMLLICFFCMVLAVHAQTQCPSSCTCMLPTDAQNMKGYSLCGGKQTVCGYDKAKNPMYCYQAPVTTTATKTAIPTTPPPSCPSACTCMLPGSAEKQGYLPCGGKLTLCGYDQYQNPKYCYQAPATTTATSRPTTAVTQALQYIERTLAGTLVTPTATMPMAVAPGRCMISGAVFGFYHDPSTLKIQVTNLDTGSSTLTSVSPVYSGDLVSHYSYTALANCNGNYQVEPVYQPFTGVCAWTGSFTGSPVVHMTGSSETGRDFTYVPDDPNIPDVNVIANPASPGVNQDVRITVQGIDDDSIVFMAARYELVYSDGTRRSVDWRELTPMAALATRAGDRPRWTGHFDITDDGLARAEVTARVCDAGGNERWGSGTVTWATCSWCNEHVIPILLNGNTADKIDVIFVPDTSYGGDMAVFVEDITDVIENGYYRNTLFSANREKFNFYYLDEEADVSGYPTAGFTPPLGSCENFQDATTFADSIAVLHTDDLRDWAGTRCERRVFTSEPTSYRTFVHESGHALFGLKDEYCCDSRYSQNDPNPNIWSSEDACRDDATAEGWDPDDCREFCTSGSGNCGSGFWKIDPNHCVMRCSQACGNNCCTACGGADAMCQYEPACARRVNAVLSGFV